MEEERVRVGEEGLVGAETEDHEDLEGGGNKIK